MIRSKEGLLSSLQPTKLHVNQNELIALDIKLLDTCEIQVSPAVKFLA